MVVRAGGQHASGVVSRGLQTWTIPIIVAAQPLFHHPNQGRVKVDVFFGTVEALALFHRQLNPCHLDGGLVVHVQNGGHGTGEETREREGREE